MRQGSTVEKGCFLTLSIIFLIREFLCTYRSISYIILAFKDVVQLYIAERKITTTPIQQFERKKISPLDLFAKWRKDPRIMRFENELGERSSEMIM